MATAADIALPEPIHDLYQGLNEIFLADGDNEGDRNDVHRPLNYQSIDAMKTALDEVVTHWQVLQQNGQTTLADFAAVDNIVRQRVATWRDQRRKRVAAYIATAVSLAVLDSEDWSGHVTILPLQPPSFVDLEVVQMVPAIVNMPRGANRSIAMHLCGMEMMYAELTHLDNVARNQRTTHGFGAPPASTGGGERGGARGGRGRGGRGRGGAAVPHLPASPPPPPPVPAPRGRGAGRGRGRGRGGNAGPQGHGTPGWTTNESIALLEYFERNWDGDLRVQRVAVHIAATNVVRTWEAMRQQLVKLRTANWTSASLRHARNNNLPIRW